MTTADDAMLIILALDPTASVKYSGSTHRWYVASRIAIGDGFLLGSVTEHHDSPGSAILAFLGKLTEIGADEFVVSSYQGYRREWRWNGAAFAEQTRESALALARQ